MCCNKCSKPIRGFVDMMRILIYHLGWVGQFGKQQAWTSTQYSSQIHLFVDIQRPLIPLPSFRLCDLLLPLGYWLAMKKEGISLEITGGGKTSGLFCFSLGGHSTKL